MPKSEPWGVDLSVAGEQSDEQGDLTFGWTERERESVVYRHGHGASGE